MFSTKQQECVNKLKGNCGERELRAIDDCLRNAQRISYLLPPEMYEELNRNLDEIRTMLSTHLQSEGTTAFSVSQSSSGEFLFFKTMFFICSNHIHKRGILESSFLSCLCVCLLSALYFGHDGSHGNKTVTFPSVCIKSSLTSVHAM